jgi:RND family efflux transporter MFP subunit
MTRALPLAAASAALAALVSACGGHADKASLPATGDAPARAVRIARPATILETALGRATGVIRSRDEATLASKTTGQIKRVRVQVGDRVRKGQPLVEMDAAIPQASVQNARAALRVAEANLDSAERELARAKQLHAEEGISESGMDRAQTARDMAAAQTEQARAAVRIAEQNLADTVLRAPFDGTITAKHKSAGDTVTSMPVTPILGIVDTDHLEVKLSVPEAIEGFARPGAFVRGQSTLGGQTFEAKVRVKGAVIDPQTRSVEVLADVVKSEGTLRAGTVVTVDLGSFGAKGDVFVPASAVQRDGDQAFVLVVASGKAERRDVQASAVHPGTVMVAGLAPDAAVVVDPGVLAPGDAVVALPE